jgi:hypothetical protein
MCVTCEVSSWRWMDERTGGSVLFSSVSVAPRWRARSSVDGCHSHQLRYRLAYAVRRYMRTWELLHPWTTSFITLECTVCLLSTHGRVCVNKLSPAVISTRGSVATSECLALASYSGGPWFKSRLYWHVFLVSFNPCGKILYGALN